MQRKALWQRASIAVTTLIMAGFGFTGLASAASISNTGPNSRNTITTTENTVCTTTNNNNVSVENSNHQTAVSGSVTVSDNTNAGTYWQGWLSLSPTAAQANGESYSAWWTNLTSWLANHNDAAQWMSTNQNTAWTPSGSNWQSTWANWDPALWQANGQTYLNWYTQLEAWLGSNSANWMMTWPAGDTGSGGATSGNATNTNRTNFWVNINNGVTPENQQGQGSCGVVSTSSPGKGGGGTISQTGPGSTNAIFTAASGVTARTNNTAVGVGNGNGQAAFSGHVSGHANTTLGAARSGNASNGNGTSGSVGVTSTPPSGGQGGGVCPPASSGANIVSTGPGSSNSISSSTSSYSNVTNNNNVSIANTSSQSAYSGSSTSSYNTAVVGSGSGAATNGNATGADVDVTN